MIQVLIQVLIQFHFQVPHQFLIQFLCQVLDQVVIKVLFQILIQVATHPSYKPSSTPCPGPSLPPKESSLSVVNPSGILRDIDLISGIKDSDNMAWNTLSSSFDSSSLSLNASQIFLIGMLPSVYHEKSSKAIYLPDGTLVDANDDHPPYKLIPDHLLADTPVKSING